MNAKITENKANRANPTRESEESRKAGFRNQFIFKEKSKKTKESQQRQRKTSFEVQGLFMTISTKSRGQKCKLIKVVKDLSSDRKKK